jgi:hypothetical protein
MARKSVKATRLKVGLPFDLGELELEPNETQQRAAWSLYVELMTRIAIQPLGSDEGILREALASLYKIFEVTRQILKDAGPEVAKGKNAFGPVAIRVLNEGLRPFLAKWHPLLKAYEDVRPLSVGMRDHERAWEHNLTIRTELTKVQQEMLTYAYALAEIAGVEEG